MSQTPGPPASAPAHVFLPPPVTSPTSLVSPVALTTSRQEPLRTRAPRFWARVVVACPGSGRHHLTPHSFTSFLAGLLPPFSRPEVPPENRNSNRVEPSPPLHIRNPSAASHCLQGETQTPEPDVRDSSSSDPRPSGEPAPSATEELLTSPGLAARPRSAPVAASVCAHPPPSPAWPCWVPVSQDSSTHLRVFSGSPPHFWLGLNSVILSVPHPCCLSCGVVPTCPPSLCPTQSWAPGLYSHDLAQCPLLAGAE